MKWSMPVVAEVCVGMEVTSYESAEIDPFNYGLARFAPPAGAAGRRSAYDTRMPARDQQPASRSSAEVEGGTP
jgi:coenzyme PQQ precursor peptide PqqA